jgi:LacI family transcriptional regulator
MLMPAGAAPTRVRTQAELAALLGVSQVSVHKALTNQSGVGEALRRRIVTTAAECGYRLNAGAKAMRRGTFGCVSLLQSVLAVRSLLPPRLLEGIQRALVEFDQQLMISVIPDDKLTSEGYVPKILREVMADGLLINYNAMIPPQMVELIERHRIPSVWLNSKQPHDAVYPDDLSSAADATRRLLALGHRRILFYDFIATIAKTPWHYSNIDRLEGYCRTVREAGLAPIYAGHGLSIERNTHDELVTLLKSPGRPTAVLCYSQREARAVLFACVRAGLRVPDDVSLVSFGAGQESELGLRFTTARLPELAIGDRAVRMLMSKLRVEPHVFPSVAIPCEWLAGDTVAVSPQE